MTTAKLCSHSYTIDCEHDDKEEMSRISEEIDESRSLTQAQKLHLYRRLARRQLNLPV